MADVFPKETFESGSTPFSFDSEENVYGSSTLALDTGSKVAGVNSIGISATAESGHYFQKNFGANYTELFLQFKAFIPTGFAHPTGGFFVIFGFLRPDGAVGVVEVKIEDYGSNRLVIQGSELPYTDTGIDIALDTVTKIEIRIVKHASAGIIQVWKDNNTEGSPTFSATSQNTGSTEMRYLLAGMYYTPGTFGTMYLDDIQVADAFIGAGVSPATHFLLKEQDAAMILQENDDDIGLEQTL